jgi:hypothetical protein
LLNIFSNSRFERRRPSAVNATDFPCFLDFSDPDEEDSEGPTWGMNPVTGEKIFFRE